MFLVAVGFWNFLGAGIFGFLINLPIVSYYEIGTALTANHGHAAMMGVYGMLARRAGAVLPALPDPGGQVAGASWAQDLVLVAQHRAGLDGASPRCCRSGILQLYESVNDGYFEARQLKFLTNDTNTRARVAAAARATSSSSSAARCRRSTSPTSASATRSSASRSTSPTTSCSPRSPSRPGSSRRHDEATAARLT